MQKNAYTHLDSLTSETLLWKVITQNSSNLVGREGSHGALAFRNLRVQSWT